MDNISIIFQIIVSLSVYFVWVLRYEKVKKEFKDFSYPDTLRNLVGALKISCSSLLLAGIWFKELTLFGALPMAFFMLCAQISHLRIRNPIIKFVPSLIFLIMSLFISAYNYGII